MVKKLNTQFLTAKIFVLLHFYAIIRQFACFDVCDLIILQELCGYAAVVLSGVCISNCKTGSLKC